MTRLSDEFQSTTFAVGNGFSAASNRPASVSSSYIAGQPPTNGSFANVM